MYMFTSTHFGERDDNIANVKKVLMSRQCLTMNCNSI